VQGPERCREKTSAQAGLAAGRRGQRDTHIAGLLERFDPAQLPREPWTYQPV